MRNSLLIRIWHLLQRSENKKLALLWDKAEPVSLAELKVRFADLARNELKYRGDQPSVDCEELTFEELWRIFESLEDLEECPIIS